MDEMHIPERHYSKDDVKVLCNTAGFEAADIDQVRADLNEQATYYLSERNALPNRPRSSDISRELRSLLTRITRLHDGLEGLSDETADALFEGLEAQNSMDTMRRIGGRLPESDPSLFIPIDDPASSLHGIILGLEEVSHILLGLQKATNGAISRLPKGHGGENRDLCLHTWMEAMARLWDRCTTAPFTRDETEEGEPITPAARFCTAAFRQIAPDYPQSRVLWEMRDTIKRRKRVT